MSHGINNANYGINASVSLGSTAHPFSSVQLTAHTSIGKYDNGVFVHGLPGGAGFVILIRFEGNNSVMN